MIDARSEKNLSEVHPDLARLMRAVAEMPGVKFVVTEGRRSIQRQADLIASGASRIKDPSLGRHVQGMAVDVYVLGEDGRGGWDLPRYREFASIVLGVGLRLGIPVVWGGAWRTFTDAPHFELPREEYPGSYIAPEGHRTVQT